jgi:uncharacterized protein (DUF2249 family)
MSQKVECIEEHCPVVVPVSQQLERRHATLFAADSLAVGRHDWRAGSLRVN